jgi:hypothetical protein
MRQLYAPHGKYWSSFRTEIEAEADQHLMKREAADETSISFVQVLKLDVVKGALMRVSGSRQHPCFRKALCVFDLTAPVVPSELCMQVCLL